MTTEEYGQKLMELLRYIGVIKDDKIKIQRYVHVVPSFYAYWLIFDESKILDAIMTKAKQLYEHNRNKTTIQKSWDNKKKSFMEQRKEGFKPSPLRNNPK